VLAKLGVDQLNAALARWNNWRQPAVRNGALTALLKAAQSFCLRHGA